MSFIKGETTVEIKIDSVQKLFHYFVKFFLYGKFQIFETDIQSIKGITYIQFYFDEKMSKYIGDTPQISAVMQPIVTLIKEMDTQFSFRLNEQAAYIKCSHPLSFIMDEETITVSQSTDQFTSYVEFRRIAIALKFGDTEILRNTFEEFLRKCLELKIIRHDEGWVHGRLMTKVTPVKKTIKKTSNKMK